MIFFKSPLKPLREEIARQRERLLADAKRREQEDKRLEGQIHHER